MIHDNPATRAVNRVESRNALLKFNSRRAERMTEEEALSRLNRLGFTRARKVRHTVHRKTSRETLVFDFERHQKNADGSPRFDRARLTVTYSV